MPAGDRRGCSSVSVSARRRRRSHRPLRFKSIISSIPRDHTVRGWHNTLVRFADHIVVVRRQEAVPFLMAFGGAGSHAGRLWSLIGVTTRQPAFCGSYCHLGGPPIGIPVALDPTRRQLAPTDLDCDGGDDWHPNAPAITRIDTYDALGACSCREANRWVSKLAHYIISAYGYN